MSDIKKAIEIINDVTWNDSGRHYGQISKVRKLVISVLEDKLNNGWISCDMDLPTISDEDINRGVSRISVLAISKYRKDTMIRQFDIEDRKFYDGGYGVGVIDNSIVAWQMLPRKSEWRVEG